MFRHTVVCFSLITAVAFTACAQQNQPQQAKPGQTGGAQHAGPSVTAPMKDRNGKDVGTVRLRQMATGVLLDVDLRDLPAGEHGFHIHETGKCDAPDFKTAGGHFNPTKSKHGYHDAAGPHAGDIPNLVVASGGTARAQFFLHHLKLDALNDADGASIMVHAKPDDYATDPAGDSGDRIACGVIGKAEGGK